MQFSHARQTESFGKRGGADASLLQLAIQLLAGRVAQEQVPPIDVVVHHVHNRMFCRTGNRSLAAFRDTRVKIPQAHK